MPEALLAYRPDEPETWRQRVEVWKRLGAVGPAPLVATTAGDVPALVLLDLLRDDPFVASVDEWHELAPAQRSARLARLPELEEAARREVEAGWAAALNPPTLSLVPAESDETGRGASWEPVDLSAVLAGGLTLPEATIGRRSDGVGLFYPGEINSLLGEPESGKSWLALAAVVERIRAGERVLYVDFESDAVSVLGRLLALGLVAGELAQLLYVRPDEALANPADIVFPVRDRFEAMVRDFSPSYAVVDGVAEAMASNGLDENSNRDSASFYALLPRRLQLAGAGVVMIDHITKSSDGRGSYARGAGHKKAGVTGSSIGVEVVLPFGRGMTGRAKLTVLKDRPGGVRPHCVGGKLAGEMVLASGDDGKVVLTVEPAAEKFRPTFFMERVSRFLEGEGTNPAQTVTQNCIVAAVTGKKDHIVAALRLLVEEGYVSTEPGPNRSTLHASARPYRQPGEGEADGPVPEPGEHDEF